MLFNFISAEDYYVSNLVIPKLAYEDKNISVEIDLVNNSTATENLDVNIDFYSPTVIDAIYHHQISDVTVPANSTLKVNHLIIINDSNASNSPHLIRVAIENADDNPGNNMMQKWITVSKGQRKTPVPDMPIALGLVVGVFVLLYIGKKK